MSTKTIPAQTIKTCDCCGVVMNWLIAQWVLSIWNPDLMNFVTSPTRKRSLKNFYRAKGIVLHDRALNGERFFHD